MERANKKTCPSCQADLAPEAVLCVGCGYHLARGKHLKTQSKRFHRTWHFGLTVGAQVGAVVFVFIGASFCTVYLWPWGGLALIFAMGFLVSVGILGRQLSLERSPMGKVELKIVQWIFFRPTVLCRVKLEEYEAAYTGYISAGKHSCYLIDIRGQNVPVIPVYDGRSQAVMKEILDCLQFEAGLAIRRKDDF